MRTLNLLARPVVALLLGFASFAVTVQAFPLVNQRPGNVLTMIMAGCGKQQSWQVRRGSGQVLACWCLSVWRL
jgi:hypothetical protein